MFRKALTANLLLEGISLNLKSSYVTTPIPNPHPNRHPNLKSWNISITSNVVLFRSAKQQRIFLLEGFPGGFSLQVFMFRSAPRANRGIFIAL